MTESQVVAAWLMRDNLCPECITVLDQDTQNLVLDEYGTGEPLWRHETCPGGAA